MIYNFGSRFDFYRIKCKTKFIYPNLLNSETFNVEIQNLDPGYYKFTLFNSMGEKVLSVNFSINKPTVQLHLSENVPSGV